ncbi:MAG: elongation factor P [Candidatus Saelkia tenebricola]|nr:elongation factor P [Candidatus Saelkia tenebricola]
MISVNQIKPGMVIKLENRLLAVVSYTHTKPGKGGAFLRLKLKDISTGQTMERTISTDDKVDNAYMEEKKLTYLYRDGSGFHFMDDETYEQVSLTEDDLGDIRLFLKENDYVSVTLHDGKIIALVNNMFVELKVVETDPGFKGDTVKSGTKPAKMETGAVIQVPLFIDNGDVIKIDTRIQEYVERV